MDSKVPSRRKEYFNIFILIITDKPRFHNNAAPP